MRMEKNIHAFIRPFKMILGCYFCDVMIKIKYIGETEI